MAQDFKYTHYMGYKPINPDWNKNLNCILVKNFKELKYLLFDKYKDATFCGFDTETTGLNPLDKDANLVGFSFSYDGKNGYYVPVNHVGYKTLEVDDSNYDENEYFNLGIEAMDLFYLKMQTHKRTFLANMVFDYNYLEYMGIKYGKDWDMSKCPYYDIFVGLFLADTNVPFPNLKKSEAQYLGWNRENFEATLGEYTNFAYVPIEMSYQYACLRKGTKVKTNEGDICIENITKGIEVMTSMGNRVVLDNYYQGKKNIIRIYLSNDDYFDCTEDHPILVLDKNRVIWKEAGLLKVDDILLELDDVKGRDLNILPILRKKSSSNNWGYVIYNDIPIDLENWILQNHDIYSHDEICAMTSLSKSLIRNILSKHNIRKKRVNKSKTFNDDILEDLPKMYYLLGLILSDGAIYDSRVFLGFQANDLDWINKLKNVYGYTPDLKLRQSRSPSNYDKICYSYCMNLCSPKLMNFIYSHIDNRLKSHRKIIKNIPDEYFKDFLRGMIDGDGTCRKHDISIACRLDIAFFLGYSILRLYNTPTYIQKENKDNNLTIIHISKEYISKLRNIMYNDTDLFLHRKFDKIKDTVFHGGKNQFSNQQKGGGYYIC